MYKPKFVIAKKDLYRLYCVERKSTPFIAKIYGCNHETISCRLREFNIPIRSKYKIPKKVLLKLYLKENRSPKFIGELYGCSFATIRNRLKKFGIPRKSKSSAQMRYPKHDFFGDDTEKSYLIGFRLGDLNVYKTNRNAETIIVRCHTTQDVQVGLMRELFGNYGKVTAKIQKDGTFYVNCFLNKSFDFLLPKEDKIEDWILANKKSFCAFMAGYTDAEGNFILNQGRARFKIDSYDKNILYGIYRWLHKSGIKSKFRKIGERGESRPDGYYFNKDLWRLNVNEANSLFEFISLIKPLILHKKRLKDVNICLKNIEKRKKLGTI